MPETTKQSDRENVRTKPTPFPVKKQEKNVSIACPIDNEKHHLGKCPDFLKKNLSKKGSILSQAQTSVLIVSHPVTRLKTANRLFNVNSPTVENDITQAFIVKIRDQRPLPPNLVILTTKTHRSKKLPQATLNLPKTRPPSSNQQLRSIPVPDSSIKQLVNFKQLPYAFMATKVLWAATPYSIPVVPHLIY